MIFFNKGRTVVFKQRTARHLAARENLAWEYQDGTIVFSDRGEKIAVIRWLQGYKDRTDEVPFEDIVSVDDKRCKEVKIGPYKGRGRLLQEVVPEGT